MMHEHKPVITVILRRKGSILIFKRSKKVSTYQNRWSGVSGSISKDETAAHAALRELKEETGINASESDLMPLNKPIMAEDGDIIWEIHPFLLDIADSSISLDWENEKYEWIDPSELHRYDTVPKLDEVVDSLLSAYGKTVKRKK